MQGGQHAGDSSGGIKKAAGPAVIALIIFAGGAAGTLLRLTLDLLPAYWVQYANILACILMGGSCALLRRRTLGPLWRQGVNVGFLGGLSTYAAPVLQSLCREDGDLVRAALDFLPQLALFLLCCALGFVLTLRLEARVRRKR